MEGGDQLQESQLSRLAALLTAHGPAVEGGLQCHWYNSAADVLAYSCIQCPTGPCHILSCRRECLTEAGCRRTVQERTGAGRSLVAKDAICAGSVALFDLPFEIALHKRHRQQVMVILVVLPSAATLLKHVGQCVAQIRCRECLTYFATCMQLCSQCTAPLPPVALPCGRCPIVAFCTAACREASAHRPGGCECGVPWTVLLPQDAVLAGRAVRRMQLLVCLGLLQHTTGIGPCQKPSLFRLCGQ